MPPTTYMIEKQAELDAYQIVNKVVKARLPKGCYFDKVSTLWRLKNHLRYFLKPVMGSTGRPRYCPGATPMLHIVQSRRHE